MRSERLVKGLGRLEHSHSSPQFQRYRMTPPRDDINEAFDRQSADPQAYLLLARTLTIAAAPELAGFREAVHAPPAEVRLEVLAYINAYMLLTGLAFENLLKATALS